MAWFLLACVQSPLRIAADTKHDLTADPWGFLGQALYPWTDIFPLGQMQNQAYGYLFPHGLFFALGGVLGPWLIQTLWWTLTLCLAFFGLRRLLALTLPAATTPTSRTIAAVLFALSPRILTTLGAISSEAWVVALAPWVLLPIVQATHLLADAAPALTPHSPARERTAPPTAPPSAPRTAPRAALRHLALRSAVVVLCMGAVNAVATAAAVLPTVVWLAVVLLRRSWRRQGAFRLSLWWVGGCLLACLWWIGPLLILGRYSPPFTDFIESAGLTTRWLNPLEVLRGTTSWTPFLSTERPAGHALVIAPIFIAATLAVALLGLAGLLQLRRRRDPAALPLVLMLSLGAVIMVGAASIPGAVALLDGPAAALRNLHKFDPLLRLPLSMGVAVALAPLRLPARLADLAHPERHRPVVATLALGLLLLTATAPAWSGRLPAEDPTRGVPTYWSQAAAWLNEQATADTLPGRTLILPEAKFARHTWGNTRDEPAQPLLDVPWVVRDAVPLVAAPAIRGLDGVQRAVESGRPIPQLAGILRQQGIGAILLRRDLAASADTPGAAAIERTLRRSGGFTPAASFGGATGVTIYLLDAAPDMIVSGQARLIGPGELDVVAGGAEVLPRLAEADAALGRTAAPRPRLLAADRPGTTPDPATTTPTPLPISTITDTPLLREHNYGATVRADSAPRAPQDPTRVLNPVLDYPSTPGTTPVAVATTGGEVRASSAADDPTVFGGADATSSLTAAVDGSTLTAWRPTPGAAAGQWLELQLADPHTRLGLELATQGARARVQVTTLLRGQIVASKTVGINSRGTENPQWVSLPAGTADAVRITILSQFGDVGLAEVRVFDTSGDVERDVTPQRIVDVPTPPDPSGVTRWVLGQEVNEGLLRRRITVPELPERPGAWPLVLHAADCRTPITIDGGEHPCGAVISLDPGAHIVTTRAEWVSLTVAEPLIAAAVAQAPPATPLPTTGMDGHGRLTVTLPPGPAGRILALPSAASPARAATLDSPTSGPLTPITVNGWQQAWLLPHTTSPTTVQVTATPTRAYQAWLLLGAGAALILCALLLWTLPAYRRQHRPHHPAAPAHLTDAPTPASADAASAPTAPTGWGAVSALYATCAGVTVVAGMRGPWGSAWYAGDNLLVALSAGVLLALPLVAPALAASARWVRGAIRRG